MMDPVTLALLGIGTQAATQLVVTAGRWLTLRARADLARAAASLPTGVQVTGRDNAGVWAARRATAEGPQ